MNTDLRQTTEVKGHDCEVAYKPGSAKAWREKLNKKGFNTQTNQERMSGID